MTHTAPFNVETYSVAFTEGYEDEVYYRDVEPGGDSWDAYCAGGPL